jgi:hypothetical protein
METVHQMLPEDEVIMCGTVLLLGIVLGVAARLVASMVRQRRSA